MDAILDIRLWPAGAGAALGEYLGSFDSLLYALVAFIVTDLMREKYHPLLGTLFFDIALT